jgi:hypothetical protein
VHFRATGPAVLLAWGGHLAQSAYWNRSIGGASDGAGQVSGAPWHMRTLQLDGSGNKNQDRSIQPSAIVGELPPFALAPPTSTPRPTLAPAGPGAPGGPGGQGPGGPGPGGQVNDPTKFPNVTIPPTSTEATVVLDAASGFPALLAGSLLTSASGLLALTPLLRRRRRP